MKLWWIETQDGAFLLVFHGVMVSTFKFGGNRRFFGVDTADFVGCRGGTGAIRFPVVSDIPVSDVIARENLVVGTGCSPSIRYSQVSGTKGSVLARVECISRSGIARSDCIYA